jgi:hypothetical protein
MMAHDVSSLTEWLRRQELLGPEQLAKAAGELRALLPEAPLLFEELVFRGWQTSYHPGQFRDGGRGRFGRYLLLERRGHGGQGEVFQALERTMNRRVATARRRWGWVWRNSFDKNKLGAYPAKTWEAISWPGVREPSGRRYAPSSARFRNIAVSR